MVGPPPASFDDLLSFHTRDYLAVLRASNSGVPAPFARQFGIGVTDVRPALVPFIAGNEDRAFMGNLSGISVRAAVTCGKKSFVGNILFTHRGLSGPAVLQLSLEWTPGSPVSLNLFPDSDTLELLRENRQSRMELPTLLAGRFPRRFAQALCMRFFTIKPMNQYNDRELREMARKLHDWEISPSGTEGYGLNYYWWKITR